MKLWVVGINTAKDMFSSEEGSVWDLKGIFDTKEAALKACETVNCFVASVELNEDMGMFSTEFEDCEYPLWEELKRYANTSEEVQENFPQTREQVEAFIARKILEEG